MLGDLGPSWVWPPYQPCIAGWLDRLGIATRPQHERGDGRVERASHEPVRRMPLPGHDGQHRPLGGPLALVEALAARLPTGTVQRSVPVRGVRERDDAAALTVDTGTGAFTARHAILAMPPRVIARDVTFEPELDACLAALVRAAPTWMAAQAKPSTSDGAPRRGTTLIGRAVRIVVRPGGHPAFRPDTLGAPFRPPRDRFMRLPSHRPVPVALAFAVVLASGCSDGGDSGSGPSGVDRGEADVADDGGTGEGTGAEEVGVASGPALAGTWTTDCLTIDPPPGAAAHVDTARFDGERFDFSVEPFADTACTEDSAGPADVLSTTFVVGDAIVTADGLGAFELETSFPDDAGEGDGGTRVPNLVAMEGGTLYFGTSAFTRTPTGGRPERLDFDRPYRLE